MVESLADGELVRCAARGERAREAEAELCRRFAPRVRLYGLRHLRTEDGAADLVQSVLLVVLQAARAGRIAEPDHVDRFILGTCRNVAQRVRARESRTVPLDPAEREFSAYLPDLERVSEGALMGCLGKLDARARSVVVLSFQAEKSAEEIAQVTEISAGNVRVVRHRAIAQLRRCLDTAEGARP